MLVTVVIERASNHIASMFEKKLFNFLMKVVIDVKAINVGRYKNGDSKKIWRRVNRPIKKTEKI